MVAHGYDVCGIACTIAEAVALGHRHKPDLALIDLRLADGELGTEVAAKLSHQDGLGVLYATGNVMQIALTAANGHACLTKPYHGAELLRGLEIVADIATTGTAVPPLPRNFQILKGAEAGAECLPHG